jgi:hypothetical protein
MPFYPKPMPRINIGRNAELGAALLLCFGVTSVVTIAFGKGGVSGVVAAVSFFVGWALFVHAWWGRHWSDSMDERLRFRAAPHAEIVGGHWSHLNHYLGSVKPAHPQAVLAMDTQGVAIITADEEVRVDWPEVREVVLNWPYVNFQYGKVGRLAFMARSRREAEDALMRSVPSDIRVAGNSSPMVHALGQIVILAAFLVSTLMVVLAIRG